MRKIAVPHLRIHRVPWRGPVGRVWVQYPVAIRVGKLSAGRRRGEIGHGRRLWVVAARQVDVLSERGLRLHAGRHVPRELLACAHLLLEELVSSVFRSLGIEARFIVRRLAARLRAYKAGNMARKIFERVASAQRCS